MLSIITVTKDDPLGFFQTLKTIARIPQTLAVDWEWILVDSSNTPIFETNSYEIKVLLRDRALSHQHIAMAPSGIYAAMNKGLEVSKKKYVWFLNGGDTLISAAALSNALRLFEHHGDAPILLSPTALVAGGRQIKVHQTSNIVWGLLGKNRICHQGIIYKKHNIKEFDTSFKIAADYKHLLELLALGKPPVVSSEIFAGHDTSGISNQNWRLAFSEFYRAFDHVSKQQALPRSFRMGFYVLYLFERYVRLPAVKWRQSRESPTIPS